jgi:hypothetical protein
MKQCDSRQPVFGSGVSYFNAPAGATAYNASALGKGP